MGACGTCIKSPIRVLLVLFNLIFFLLGAALLVIGILIKTLLTSILKKYLDPILESITELPTEFDSSATTAATPSVDFAVLLSPVAYILIGIGSVLVVVTFFGCCGACCNTRYLLIIYVLLFGAIVIAESVVVGLFFTKKFDSQIRKLVEEKALNKYVDFDDYSTPSLICNVVQLYFECCGIDNYTDYNSVKTWRRTRSLTIHSVSTTFNLVTPLTCCKTVGSFPDISFPDQFCAVNASDSNNNWKTGCWGEVTHYLNKYRSDVLIGIVIAIIVEVMFIALAFFECWFAKPKANKSQANKSNANANKSQATKSNTSRSQANKSNANANRSQANKSNTNANRSQANTAIAYKLPAPRAIDPRVMNYYYSNY